MKLIRKISIMIFSNFLIALAVIGFIAPHGMILGGATGISLVASHYIPMQLSTMILIVNGILFLIGFMTLGKNFAISTIANSILYPACMFILERFLNGTLTSNIMLAAIFGGVLMGAGVGLILRTGGSSGGTDILALILDKHLHFNLSIILYIIDGIILSLQIPFSNSEQILLGIFVLALITLTMNKIMLLGKTQIQIFIISDEIEIIRERILLEDAGATMFQIERGFTSKKDRGIMCIIPRRKLFNVCKMISEVDPHAFFTISEVNEVRGLGFSYGKH